MAQHNTINSEAKLRQHFPAAGERAILKVQKKLDKHCRDFIARSPFLCIGTSRADGCADVSPRGDPPGFVHVAGDILSDHLNSSMSGDEIEERLHKLNQSGLYND